MRNFGFFPTMIWAGALPWAAALLLATTQPGSAADAPATEISPKGISPSDWNRSLIRQGHASERLGQKQDALADYTLAIESQVLAGNDRVQALFDRGLLLDGLGRLTDALADYNAALSMSPQFVAALNNRASIYTRLGRLAEARSDYLSALSAGGPESRYSYFGLGQIAEVQGSPTEAKDFYSRALAADPNFALASERLAALSDARQIFSPLSPTAGAIGRSAEDMPGSGSGTDVHPKTLIPDPILTAVENAPPHVPSSAPALRDAQVQLGAWRSPERAVEGWNQARVLAGEILGGFSPRIVAVDLPGAGRYYRLRVAVVRNGPRAFCAALAAKGLDCIPARD